MLRSGSICISFLYNYLLSEIQTNNNKTENGTTLINKVTKLECLASTFQSYGGVLAKLSQILSLDDGKSSVFSDCKPYCQEETIAYLKDEYTKNSEFFKNITHLDFNVFKSGSVGQVHKGVYNDNTNIIIKVQYLGLREQFKSDLFILDKVTSYLFHFSDLSNAMTDIKTKVYEELDYKREFENQNNMYNIWKEHKNIKIAELIPELCNEKLLTMEYIDAEGLSSFIDTSTQEEKNLIGKYMVEFIFVNFYKYGIFYSDIHYGNFLIKYKQVLYVTDFGCINNIDDILLNNLKNLHKAVSNDDKDAFYKIVTDIGILVPNISIESKEYMYDYFKLQYTPWTQDNFEFTDEWFVESKFKKTELMTEWKLPSNCVYLNKIPFGGYHIFTKLKLKYDFTCLFKELLDL